MKWFATIVGLIIGLPILLVLAISAKSYLELRSDLKEPLVRFIHSVGMDSYAKPAQVPQDVFGSSTEVSTWNTRLENGGFISGTKDGKCNWGFRNAAFLNEYDTCAYRIVGPSSCKYVYLYAANIQDGKISDPIMTNFEYICL